MTQPAHHSPDAPDGVSALGAALDAALDAAERALRNDPAHPLDAVAWVSAHLATAERTVHPVAARLSPPADLAALHRAAGDLLAVVRRIEQQRAGDALAARLDAPTLRGRAHLAIAAYRAAETAVAQRLQDELPPAAIAALVTDYRRRLVRAPTRPHPHTPRHGPLASLGFRIDGLTDRVLNVMDSRPVPTPRRPVRTPDAGLWTRYLLGR